MKTFLFLWNPKKWNWQTLEQDIEAIEKTGSVKIKWSVISHKVIKPSDRAFLMRLGEEPKGIMASGYITTKPFLSRHWGGGDKLVNKVVIDFEVLLNPLKQPLLSLEILKQGNLSNINWTPQSSGIEIKSEKAIEELEAIWFDFLQTHEVKKDFYGDIKNTNNEIFMEGIPSQISITKYERNPHARKECIKYFGYSCMICGIDFEKTYGDIGKNFIQVHHLKPIADIGGENGVDPIRDLRPLCPNCHAMVHRRKEPYTIDELKEMIKNKTY